MSTSRAFLSRLIKKPEVQTATENPYLSNLNEFNSREAELVASRRLWQNLAVLALLITLAAVGGMIYIGSQSKFVPYIVEVDKHGGTLVVGAATAASTADVRVIRASVADFISSARMVTGDVELQREAIFRVYSMLAPNDPARSKMDVFMDGTEDSSPLARAQKERVSIEIQSVLQQTEQTWQVDWIEKTFDKAGALKKQEPMRALVTIRLRADTAFPDEKELLLNPLGVNVVDYSWSQTTSI